MAKKEKILIVDDNEGFRGALGDLLRYYNIAYLTASNGEQAMEMIKEHKPSHVFLDVKMKGGMNGLEVCRQIKATHLSMKPLVVLLTACSENEFKEQHLADRYINKPFNPEDILEIIRPAAACVCAR